MPLKEQIVQIDRDILGGKPVFAGTRVPLQTLFDYLRKTMTFLNFWMISPP